MNRTSDRGLCNLRGLFLRAASLYHLPPMPAPEIPASDETFNRQQTKRQPLYIRMYFDPVYVEFVRFIGYDGKPLPEAEHFLLELEKRYSREKVIDAGEAVSTSEGKAENMTVRLTAEARRLAWQLLGPPPEHKRTDMIAEIIASGERLKPDPKPPDKPKKPRQPRPKKTPDTPASCLPQQYRDAKERHPGMLLLFRMGDFYELFAEDAEVAAKLLGLTLTTRDRTLAMAGFPHHSLETHLRKLLQAGHRVAICEQVDTVRREVTRVVTAGTANDEADATENAAAARRPPASFFSSDSCIYNKERS